MRFVGFDQRQSGTHQRVTRRRQVGDQGGGAEYLRGVCAPYPECVEVLLCHAVTRSRREFWHGVEVQGDTQRVPILTSRVLIDGEDSVLDVVAQHLAHPAYT